MTRRPVIAANWKLNKLAGEARAFVSDLRARLSAVANEPEVVVAPPFTALAAVAEAIEGSEIQLAAQNVSAETDGAFTGEVSAAMLADAGCAYAVVGHSERRSLYGETSDLVARKTGRLLEAGLRPIVCVGETLEEREAERTEAVVAQQVDASLSGVPADRASALVVAYEPVWAIGTGKTASPAQAQAVHRFIRDRLQKMFGPVAEEIRIQYGGSVKPENVAEIMAQPDIDGALVGGASLHAESFAQIVAYDRLENVSS